MNVDNIGIFILICEKLKLIFAVHIVRYIWKLACISLFLHRSVLSFHRKGYNMNEQKESQEMLPSSTTEKIHKTEGKRDEQEEKEDEDGSKKLVNTPDDHNETIVIAEDVKLLRLRMKIFQTMVIYAVYFSAVSFEWKTLDFKCCDFILSDIFALLFRKV